TSGLASLLKPIWVSLIWTNSGLPIERALCGSVAAPARSMGVNTPPVNANRVPAPPAARHFNALRRDKSWESSDTEVSCGGGCLRRTTRGRRLFPSFRPCAGEGSWECPVPLLPGGGLGRRPHHRIPQFVAQ